MSLTTAQEVLDLWAKNESAEAKAERREIESLRKDIGAAQSSIRDAIARYRKKKLCARSKAQANSEDAFRDLTDYSSKDQIQDAYGWDLITRKEMERLMELWELRETSNRKAGLYTDRVTEMLERAEQAVWDAYGGQVMDYEERISQMRRAAEEIASENIRRDYERQAG